MARMMREKGATCKGKCERGFREEVGGMARQPRAEWERGEETWLFLLL